MRIIRTKDYTELSKVAADIIAAQVRLKPNSILGLATGSTPIGLYKELIRQYEDEKLDFSQIRTFNLDEYVGLDGNNDQSYRYFMNNQLFNHINIDKDSTAVPSGVASNLEAEAERYDKSMQDAGGTDLQLLGMGNNGHIGFNEPADFFTEKTNIVDLKQSTIDANSRFFASANDVPKQAITMGYGQIMKSKCVLLVVSGKNKAKTLQQVVEGNITPQVPASILRLHPNVIVVADEEALTW